MPLEGKLRMQKGLRLLNKLLIYFTKIIILFAFYRKESQIIDYQTQQYRLFPSLATTYAFLFTASTFNKMIFSFKAETKNFTEMNTSELGKVIVSFSSILFKNKI